MNISIFKLGGHVLRKVKALSVSSKLLYVSQSCLFVLHKGGKIITPLDEESQHLF